MNAYPRRQSAVPRSSGHRNRRCAAASATGGFWRWAALSLACLTGCSLAGQPESVATGGCALDRFPMPWRGIHVIIDGNSIDRLADAAKTVLPELGINVLVIEVDYSFEFESHPELRETVPITKEQARRFREICTENGIHLIVQFQSLGHQSWAAHTHPLLVKYPEFDETPEIPLDNPGIYCRSWCPLHPGVYEIVFELMDEIIDAFEPDAFHAGMDEVQLIAHEQCPRCRGKDPAKLFARAVRDIHAHVKGRRGLDMLIWGDMLVDPDKAPFVAGPRTHRAVDMIPKDVIVCDWQYGWQNRYPSIDYFLDHGLRVWPSGWNSPDATKMLILAGERSAEEKMLGHLFTVWGGGSQLAEVLMAGLDHEDARGNIRGVAEAILEHSDLVQSAPKTTLDVPIGDWPADRPAPLRLGLHKDGNFGAEVLAARATAAVLSAKGEEVLQLGEVSAEDGCREFLVELEPGHYSAALRGTAGLADGREQSFEVLSTSFGVTPPMQHAARNATVWLGYPPSVKYPAEGASSLTDGIVGDTSWEWGNWVSFLGDDLYATIDLGRTISVASVAAHFLQNQGPHVFMPVEVRFALSEDGIHFQDVATVKPETSPRHNGAAIEALEAATSPTDARYVRVHGVSYGMCPQWHAGRGHKAWLMCGEIVVNPGEPGAVGGVAKQ